MKKLLIGIAAMTFTVSIGTTTAFAAGNGWGRNFIDADNDGICDYYNTSCPFIDSNGDGICDNCGLGMCAMGAGFVDADGDGICDNYGTDRCRRGIGFVDADGDGICDHITAGMPRNGAGFHRGHFGGQGRWR